MTGFPHLNSGSSEQYNYFLCFFELNRSFIHKIWMKYFRKNFIMNYSQQWYSKKNKNFLFFEIKLIIQCEKVILKTSIIPMIYHWKTGNPKTCWNTTVKINGLKLQIMTGMSWHDNETISA